MRTPKIRFLMLFLALGLLPSAIAQTAKPYPTAATPKAVDLGALTVQSGATPISITIALHLRDVNGAENLLKSLHTQGDPQYHQFLTADQFVARFAPSDADIAHVVAGLAKYGLAAERTTATTLRVTGLPAQMENAFSVSLHSYQVPARGNVSGYTYHAPLSPLTIPDEISALVAGVAGLDSRPSLRPFHERAPQIQAKPQSTVPATTGNPFGFLTVIDFASQYDVGPLYKRGLSGRGRTIGIMTFAALTPSDPFAYWSALGLEVDPNRLSIVNVDGGPGAPSDASGSDETTLDVEQSGGIAPGAKIIVYQAPNTNQGFVDVLAAVADANKAETVSMSWGSWEWFNNLENCPVSNPVNGQPASCLQAFHELLVRAAIQGQTIFASAGDDGAYSADESDNCYPSGCTLPLSVGYPANDTAITSAGGTTLPGLQEYCLNAACTPPFYDINIKHERVWGWDYLIGLCEALGYDPLSCGIFPGGGGGGVSVLFRRPWYQDGLQGVQRSQPGQIWDASAAVGAQLGVGTYFALPGHYPGRNVPDVSFNADPETGYVIYYTSEPSGVSVILTYYGGTSFVAPQLNGVSALLGEDLHSRLGLLNFPLYALAQTGQAYGGHDAPLHAIKHGDNWFYHGSDGYNPAAGLGTLDVANFAKVLRRQF